MSAKDLETSLRQGGEKVNEGRIRIDSARALKRLRDFRFAEPSHWVLEVLRAATLSGAKNVEVRTDADDVELSFDGKPFPSELMKHLLEQALNGGPTPDEQRTRLLALGAAGALGVGARYVKIHSGGIALTLEGDKVELLETPGKGTTLHLRKAFGWRVTAAFLRGAPEVVAIRDFAHHFPAKLTLNGATISRARPEKATKVLEAEGYRMELYLPAGAPLRSSEVEVDVAGVVVAEKTLVLPGMQLQAWLRADGVRRNASGSDVVDDDETFQAALLALRKASRELLGAKGKELAAFDDWREYFIKRLLEEELDAQVKKQLEQLPLIPGPSGEWLTIAELEEAAGEHSRVYIARREYPKGSYPEPTVLLADDLSFGQLLPSGKRIDVAELVKAKEVIAINRQRLEQSEVEAASLPDRSWVARAKIDATAVTGEVGFEGSGNGAFVRVLHKGRLMESGELTALAPLRLRAVIDWGRPLADTFFTENGATKLLGLVLKYVEAAATTAICQALPKPEALPHALDLLTRLVTLRGSNVEQLPPALLAAPLFPCLGGADVSLATLEAETRWRYVNSRFPRGLLDGSRVLVLSPTQRDILKALNAKRLEDVTTQLRDEEEVRRRLSGPRSKPEVGGVVAKVKVEGEGLTGEVGVPRNAGGRLSLTLLKSGLVLETTELAPRYHHSLASVDCEALTPNARWTGATRDGAFKQVVAALSDAERRLAAELVKVPRRDWPLGAELFLIAFLKKELHAFDPSKLDDLTRAVASAPLFNGAFASRSLLQLKEQVDRTGEFHVLTPSMLRPSIPDGFEVLLETNAIATVLGETLGVAPTDPSAKLAVLDARRRLAALPVVEFKLGDKVSLECRLTEARFTVLAGLREGVGDQAGGQVFVDGRVYAVLLVPCALPLEVAIDAPGFEPNTSRELTAAQRETVTDLVGKAMIAVLRRALGQKNDPDARRALLLALSHGVDLSLPKQDAEALENCELLPCTDGRVRNFNSIDHESPQFVVTRMEGVLPNRRPIVVAAEPVVRLAMRRWPRSEQVDAALTLQLSAHRQREAVAAVSEIVSKVESPFRLRFDEREMRGEVVIARAGAGRVELYFDQKPLCVLEGALPHPLAGAIDSPRLTPKPGYAGVIEDAQFKEAIDALRLVGERLAEKAATAPRKPEWEAPLVQLAFQIGASLAWQWAGKKKKGKGKKKEAPAQSSSHPLLAAPLLRATDTSPLSLNALIEQQQANGKIDVARQGGRFLEAGRKAWWPRPEEERLAAPLAFTLNDVTAEIHLADSIRQRPRFTDIRSPLAGKWREPVRGPSLEGEVAISDGPDGKLVIEVLHERMLIETWSSDHPVGGTARVDSAALTPDERWTSAKRDASFKAMVTATEAALERLVVRRLSGDVRDAQFRVWAGLAVRWRAGDGGPLAQLVPSLPLFVDLAGKPVTVGGAIDLAARSGRVALSRPFSGELGTVVLLDSPDTRGLLTMLGLKFEDVSGELKRSSDLKQTLTTRRLASLTWKGEALVKVAVSQGPLSGELALSREFSKGGVMLARDGISVGPLEDSWPGVVGVIDVKDLAVNDDWTTAMPTRAQRSLIKAQVERLFVSLADAAPSLGEGDRELAAAWALRYLSDLGVEAAGHLDRLTGASSDLADAPLFLTVEGQKVTLRSVASEVSSRDRVAVLSRSAGVPDGVVSCVLATSSFDAPWLEALEDVLGKSKVWRVTELEAWQRLVREADPPEGAPELQGLRALRREVRLLRSGALGQLTPDELEDVKLSRAGGGTALRYDRKRKLVLLDPEHPDVERALKEAQQRPERIWVLIAAVFGLVNRELENVTDAQEAQLLMSLAGHLASNPKLLA